MQELKYACQRLEKTHENKELNEWKTLALCYSVEQADAYKKKCEKEEPTFEYRLAKKKES